MIQQDLTTGTNPEGPGSRTRDEALQIVMHYSCTILAKILHILVYVSILKGFLIYKIEATGSRTRRIRGSNPGRRASKFDELLLYHSGENFAYSGRGLLWLVLHVLATPVSTLEL